MVVFNKEYTYLENIIILLLFLSLKTHTFTEFTFNLLVSFYQLKKIKEANFGGEGVFQLTENISRYSPEIHNLIGWAVEQVYALDGQTDVVLFYIINMIFDIFKAFNIFLLPISELQSFLNSL